MVAIIVGGESVMLFSRKVKGFSVFSTRIAFSMAPNRKRGARSSGDQREWNVGDLVLAKVKGFPAWPARVDDSVKWGFPAEGRKVFVYFFGTRQIAFCNPVDVEAFTEEKKEHFQLKRHVKAHDFNLAVREIVEYIDKLKNEGKSTNIGEFTIPNGSNSAESLADTDVRGEASKETSGTFRESTNSSKVKFGDVITVGEASAAAKQDPFHVEETPSEDPTCNVNEKEVSLPTMHTMKNNRVTQEQNIITEKKVMSARLSRNSSRVNSHKLRNSKLPSSNIIKTAGIVDQNGHRDASSRSKRIKKSPDVFELNDVDSPAFVSSSSYEKNDSETGTVNSDILSFNVGSTVESGYKLAQTESVVECSKGHTELIQRPDSRSGAVIVKKKRKPSKKRANSGTNELIIGRLEKQTESEIEEHTAGQTLPSSNKDWDAKYNNEDGDEHLPLLKRARVRMGRLSSEDEEPDSSVQPEEKPSEVSDCQMVRLKAPLNSEVDSPQDKNPSVGVEEFDNSSITNRFPLIKPPHREVKKSFGCPLDVEAALPPSKRILRALEAMSANVAEDVQETSKAPSSMRTFVNASCFSAVSDCYNMSPSNKSEAETILHNVDLSGRIASQDDILGCSTNLISLGDDKDPASYAEAEDCNISLRGNYSPKPTSCGTGVAVEVVDYSDCKDPGVSSLSKNLLESTVMSQRPITSEVVLDRGMISHKGKKEDILRPSVNNHQILNVEVGKLFEEDDLTGTSAKNLDLVLASEGIISGSTHVDTDPLPCNLQNNCDTKNLSKLDTDKDNKDEGMFVLKEKTTVKDSEVFPSSPKEARPTSLQDVPHLLQSSSDSEDHSSCKDVSGILSSPSSNGGSDSALVPLDNSSGCNMAASDNAVLHSNNGCCSLDAPSPHEYPKHAGKENGKVQASDALASFKVFLRLLTRTKDSIGCVTRIALECGKLGIASEVVEVLACYLEREPSLSKRVDLFFLVDSILQCSRGLKGDIGGLFSSAIQALLPRFLLAAAPPGSNGQENRRQCLKVLKLWQERRVFPELVIHRHIHDLDSACNPASAEDDPHREVEGMVDEYRSDSSYQLPGSRMPKDEGCDSDGENFEAVTPEHNSEKPEGQIPIPAKGKQNYLLDPVDGEVEMEDASPWEADMGSTGNVRVHIGEDSKHRFEQKSPVNFPPPPPKNVAPSSPRIAPPPPLPQLPPPSRPLLSALPTPVTNVIDSKLYTNDGKQQFNTPCSVAPRVDPISLDGSSCHAPKNEDLRISMQIPETANTGSFGSVPVPHSPIRPVNSYSQLDGAISHSKTFHLRPHISESVNSCPSGSVPVSRLAVQPVNSAPQVNGALLQKKSFHLRPPQPAPSNQFSYVKADLRKAEHRTPTREIPPLSYPNRFHFLRSRDRGNFYGDHDRFEAGPHDVGNNWSHSEPSLAGPNYHDRRRLPYAHGPYGGPLREPPLPNRSWAFPLRTMNHREVMPRRPPLGSPSPVASRGPNYWRPSP